MFARIQRRGEKTFRKKEGNIRPPRERRPQIPHREGGIQEPRKKGEAKKRLWSKLTAKKSRRKTNNDRGGGGGKRDEQEDFGKKKKGKPPTAALDSHCEGLKGAFWVRLKGEKSESLKRKHIIGPDKKERKKKTPNAGRKKEVEKGGGEGRRPTTKGE